MQCALRAGCRTSGGALRRMVCRAQLPPPAAGGNAARRGLSRCANSAAAGCAGSSSASGLAGLLRLLRDQQRRSTFRTFSSGGGGGGNGGSSGGGGGGGGGGGLWAAYLALLERKPLQTKALTASLLNGLGDVLAQLQFEKGEGFNWKRLGVFTFLGLALIGPALHFWYGSLGRLVTAGGTTGAVMRLALDQLGFAPIFIATIVSSIMLLEGVPRGDILPRVRRDLPDMVKSNWLLWVPFQFVNFRFVPPQLQVLAANVVALAWNTYMSWKSHA